MYERGLPKTTRKNGILRVFVAHDQSPHKILQITAKMPRDVELQKQGATMNAVQVCA